MSTKNDVHGQMLRLCQSIERLSEAVKHGETIAQIDMLELVLQARLSTYYVSLMETSTRSFTERRAQSNSIAGANA